MSTARFAALLLCRFQQLKLNSDDKSELSGLVIARTETLHSPYLCKGSFE
jgi:hypothetical protein